MAKLQKQQWEGINEGIEAESVERYFKQPAARQAHMLELSKAAAKSNTLSNSKRSLPQKKLPRQTKLRKLRTKIFQYQKGAVQNGFVEKAWVNPKKS